MKKSILDTAIAEKNKSLSASFKKEWNEADHKRMKQALKKAFVMKMIPTKDGSRTIYTYAQLTELLGLPYTSSSAYAGLWVTNTEAYNTKYPGFHYIGFAITEDNKCYGILWDAEENEVLIQL
jgi:hypothetical protein